jgi:hypothetical protein
MQTASRSLTSASLRPLSEKSLEAQVIAALVAHLTADDLV